MVRRELGRTHAFKCYSCRSIVVYVSYTVSFTHCDHSSLSCFVYKLMYVTTFVYKDRKKVQVELLESSIEEIYTDVL